MEPFLTDKHLVLQRSVRSFCEKELAPIAAEIDQQARFPWEVMEKMGPLGYFGIQAPRKWGGAGLEFTLSDKVHQLKPGEAIHFNSDVAYKLRNLTQRATRCLVVLYTP
jgi:alkylation response protein AidB-like acyl-CoA dehydrogenase